MVATLTVKEPLEVLLKSTVYGFKASLEFTEQVVLGAVVVQEKYIACHFRRSRRQITVDVPV